MGDFYNKAKQSFACNYATNVRNLSDFCIAVFVHLRGILAKNGKQVCEERFAFFARLQNERRKMGFKSWKCCFSNAGLRKKYVRFLVNEIYISIRVRDEQQMPF